MDISTIFWMMVAIAYIIANSLFFFRKGRMAQAHIDSQEMVQNMAERNVLNYHQLHLDHTRMLSSYYAQYNLLKELERQKIIASIEDNSKGDIIKEENLVRSIDVSFKIYTTDGNSLEFKESYEQAN